ncbi:hypothetical protein ACTXT7_009826 [Hymenolepis weldensis]
MFHAPSCRFSKKPLRIFLAANEALSGIFSKLNFAQIDARKCEKLFRSQDILISNDLASTFLQDLYTPK